MCLVSEIRWKSWPSNNEPSTSVGRPIKRVTKFMIDSPIDT